MIATANPLSKAITPALNIQRWPLAFGLIQKGNIEMQNLKRKNPNVCGVRAPIKIKLLGSKFDAHSYTASKNEYQAARAPIDDAASWLMKQNFRQQALYDCREKFGIRASQLAEVWAIAAKIRRRGVPVSNAVIGGAS